VFERAKTVYALDRAATVIGGHFINLPNISVTNKSAIGVSSYSEILREIWKQTGNKYFIARSLIQESGEKRGQIVGNIISITPRDINQGFWEELITYLLSLHIEYFIQHRQHRKHRFQQF
jgi:hypothetical protein